MQYDFSERVEVSAVEVYWFDDTGAGQCRVPASWVLQYVDGGVWKPVRDASGLCVARDTWNRTEFMPVRTGALRLSVQLQDGFSGGMLEWKVEE